MNGIVLFLQRRIRPDQFSVRGDLRWVVLRQARPGAVEAETADNGHYRYFLQPACPNCSGSPAELRVKIPGSGQNILSLCHSGYFASNTTSISTIFVSPN